MFPIFIYFWNGRSLGTWTTWRGKILRNRKCQNSRSLSLRRQRASRPSSVLVTHLSPFAGDRGLMPSGWGTPPGVSHPREGKSMDKGNFP